MTDTRVGEEGNTSSTRLFLGVRMVKAGGRWPSVGLDVRGSVKNCRWPAPFTPGIDRVRPMAGGYRLPTLAVDRDRM